MRNGCLSDPRYERRMRGEGPLADLTVQMFERARTRVGLAEAAPRLSSAAFRRPSAIGPLFDGV
jgi:hypothetical protein